VHPVGTYRTNHYSFYPHTFWIHKIAPIRFWFYLLFVQY